MEDTKEHHGRGPGTPPDRARPRACAACAAPLSGPYCAQCGERVASPHDLELSGLAHDALHDFFHFDGKLVRSLVGLFARPGLLAQEFFAGRRSRYARPLGLFIFLNIVFFLVQPHTSVFGYGLDDYIGRGNAPMQKLARPKVEAHLAASGESLAVYRARFDAILQGQKKSLFVFIVPVFALCLKVAYLPRRRRYAEHLVLAVHFYAVSLLAMLALLVLYRIVISPLQRWTAVPGRGDTAFWRFAYGEEGFAVLLLAALGTWLYFALRRFYGDRPKGALARTLALFLAHYTLMHAFREVLFWTTFAAA